MSKFQMEDYEEDDYYISRMKDILEGYPRLGPLHHPSKLLEHVYIGNQDNADDLDLLQALEITHVLNCAGTRTFDLTRSPYRKDTGIVGFLMMPAEDYEEFDIMQYFMDAIVFLDKVKATGGRALVHCSIGVNRSGAIVAAYMMMHQRRPLLKVIEDLKSKRSLILQNEGFRRQLVRFARCRSLLDLPERPPKKPNFSLTDSKSVTKTTQDSNPSHERNETEHRNSEDNVGAVTSDQQISIDNSGELNSGVGVKEERKSPFTPNSNGLVGKYSGYESELGCLDGNNGKTPRKLPNLEVSSMERIREDLDRVFNKVSSLGPVGSRRPGKTDLSPLYTPTSPLSFTASNPASSFSHGFSREFSTSDATNSDNYGRKYESFENEDRSSSFSPASNSHLDHGHVIRNYPITPGSERFVSRVKPKSHYQRIPLRYPGCDSGNGELTFPKNLRSGFEKSTLRTQPLYEGGEGMLFVPYLARSYLSPSTTTQTSCPRPLSFSDRAHTTEISSYSRNTPHSRMSLSDLDIAGGLDFFPSPPRPSSGHHTPHRSPSSAFRSSAVEYDSVVDEYADLLDASMGRSNAMGAIAKSRVRNGDTPGLRKFYRY